jgi:hypothetical protein
LPWLRSSTLVGRRRPTSRRRTKGEHEERKGPWRGEKRDTPPPTDKTSPLHNPLLTVQPCSLDVSRGLSLPVEVICPRVKRSSQPFGNDPTAEELKDDVDMPIYAVLNRLCYIVKVSSLSIRTRRPIPIYHARTSTYLRTRDEIYTKLHARSNT